MRPTEQKSQPLDKQSKEEKSPEQKQLTLEELASVTGGYRPLAAVKVEDKEGNKGEAG